METLILKVPAWQGFLFISLFNADGGEGYEQNEIDEANEIIKENNLLSLTDVSEPVDDEMTCTFITKYPNE